MEVSTFLLFSHFQQTGNLPYNRQRNIVLPPIYFTKKNYERKIKQEQVYKILKYWIKVSIPHIDVPIRRNWRFYAPDIVQCNSIEHKFYNKLLFTSRILQPANDVMNCYSVQNVIVIIDMNFTQHEYTYKMLQTEFHYTD